MSPISKRSLKIGFGIGLVAILIAFFAHAKAPTSVDAPMNGVLDLRKRKKQAQDELLHLVHRE